MRNVTESTTNLPTLLTQAQATTAELGKLLTQLQGSWVLGGNGLPKLTAQRLPLREVRP